MKAQRGAGRQPETQPGTAQKVPCSVTTAPRVPDRPWGLEKMGHTPLPVSQARCAHGSHSSLITLKILSFLSLLLTVRLIFIIKYTSINVFNKLIQYFNKI